jgi:hypothetical protein
VGSQQCGVLKPAGVEWKGAVRRRMMATQTQRGFRD